MKIRTVSIIFWKKIAHSYSSKRNSYLYSQRFSPPWKKMLTEGNPDSLLQILKAVWHASNLKKVRQTDIF
jgi:hypothetical protein